MSTRANITPTGRPCSTATVASEERARHEWKSASASRREQSLSAFGRLTIRCTMYAAESRSAQDNRRAARCADALRGRRGVAAVDDDAVETAATEVTSAIVLEESFIPQW